MAVPAQLVPDGPTAPCPHCGRILPLTLRPETMHYGHVRCPDHKIQWIPKPETPDARLRREKPVNLAKVIPKEMHGFCWLCLRKDADLKAFRPSLHLEVHHVISLADGGSDQPQNLQILCRECHVDVHRRREAFSRYQPSAT